MDDQATTEAIEIIQRCSAEPPPNEQATCHWVIVPVLEALGYKLTEILPQATDSAGQRPDYEVLPGSEHAWYLEAKTWNTALYDSHVNQALNYANQNGRRWVVLSNGREWRLYDNGVQSDAQGKLIGLGTLSQAETLESILEVLSRTSVLSGGPARYSRASRLITLLERELGERDGRLLSVLVKAIRKLAPEFQDVTAEEISELLTRWRAAPTHSRADRAVATVPPPTGSRNVDVAPEPTDPPCETGFARTLRTCSDSVQVLYRALQVKVLSLGDGVSVAERRRYAAFTKSGRNFATVQPLKHKLALYLHVAPDTVSIEPGFTRDVRSIGHWGSGDLEVTLTSTGDLDRAEPLIARAYAAR